jgi:predicted ATPase
VRMGIATGEAELRDADYFGTVLNRAARVMAAGHGGQILVADSTAGLLGGADLLNLGPRRLRDVPDPITVFQLRAPGLPGDFPPLRTLDRTPGNLQPQTMSLIGRQSEVAKVVAAVRAHRLVTLTGVGGVGKTCLALEVATQLADEFPDGAWVFELAAVADPAAVPDAVATVLGITQQLGKSVAESLASALEGSVRLLVFDNCEHVLDAVADLVQAILAHSATATILATSREAVGVANEQLWPVPSLELDAALNLFCERARRVAPVFSLDDASEVAEICERLDRIPLAIELAASRISSMTAAEIRDRLDHRLKLLVGSRRGLGHHQTLRHAVAWSYDLLEDREKAALEHCSVFAGGFDLQSAWAVAGSDDVDEYGILDLLDALVRKSLLIADRSTGRTRFSMLETIREFAEEQLIAHGKATTTRTAHARHFAGREADIRAIWDSPHQHETYTWFEMELANLRAAFRWSADHGDLDSAIAVALCAHFLGTWVEQYEPVAWVEELIDAARAVGHRRLAHLSAAAAQCYAAGRVDDAVSYLEASQQTAKSADFDAVPFEIQTATGIVYAVAGQAERWADLCQSVIESEAGPHTITCASLVMALYFLNRGDEAKAASEGLLAAAEATANPNTACFALLAHGIGYQNVNPVSAYAALRRALTIARDSGNRQLESAVAVMLCVFAATEGDPLFGATDGDPIDAFDYLTVAIRHYHDAGSVSLLHNPLAILAALFDHLGKHQQAATISGFAATAMTRASYPQIITTITHLREVLGDKTYESLARKGETMTTGAMVTYAYDQISQTQLELTPTSLSK